MAVNLMAKCLQEFSPMQIQEGDKLTVRASFEVLHVLGEGAFGRVYLVKKNFLDGHLPRYFALKVFSPDTSLEVLKAEAEAMFGIRSRHCVTVHSVEKYRDHHGLLMEYVDGVTLEDLAKNVALTKDEVANICFQAHVGLHDLFLQDLFHGDVHPRNILIDRSGRVVLVDFGLAHIFSQGTIFGDPKYLNEARELGKTPCARDDIYSLKLIKFDLVNGNIGRIAPEWFWKKRKTEFIEEDVHFEDGEALSHVRVGLKVENLLEARAQKNKTLLRVGGQTFNFKLKFITFVLLVGLFSTPQAPSRGIAQVWVEIRALKWMEISFPNGMRITSDQQGARLMPGTYQVKWRTAKKSGIKTLQVHRGQTLLLSEHDFN